VQVAAAAGGSLLQALQRQNRLRAACMSLSVAERDETVVLDDDTVADTTPVLEVRLAGSNLVPSSYASIHLHDDLFFSQ
jgi:hypothetical protein